MMMNCKKAQRLYDELADGRLPETQASELRRHVADCTDCRVTQQRAARLQQLLALKQYEQPPVAYFNNFLGEFHRRLDADQARGRWWERWASQLTLESAPIWRYGLATAAVVLLAGGVYWQAGQQMNSVARADPGHAPAAAPIRLAAATEPLLPIDTPRAAPHLASSGPVIVPVADNGPGAPRYVLDRISVTPASYEAGNIRF